MSEFHMCGYCRVLVCRDSLCRRSDRGYASLFPARLPSLQAMPLSFNGIGVPLSERMGAPAEGTRSGKDGREKGIARAEECAVMWPRYVPFKRDGTNAQIYPGSNHGVNRGILELPTSPSTGC